VRVVLRPEGAHVRLTVADEGPGLPSGDAERLVEPFRQGDGADDGLGLGLAIVDRLVDLHGGQLAFHEPEDGGAAVEVPPPPPTGRAARPHRVAAGGHRSGDHPPCRGDPR